MCFLLSLFLSSQNKRTEVQQYCSKFYSDLSSCISDNVTSMIWADFALLSEFLAISLTIFQKAADYTEQLTEI